MSITMASRARCYSELARLLWRHGHWSFGKSLGLSEPSVATAANAAPGKIAGGRHDGTDVELQHKLSDPERLARDLEQLGPVYIKLAQIASTRRDLVPEKYCEALKKLQDDVAPIPASEIHTILEQALGVDARSLFASFDEVPLACASLAQVHRATMRDGREVIVKVQRPEVVERSEEQLDCLQELCDAADRSTEFGRKMRFGSLIRAVAFAFATEIDYRSEARNLNALRKNLAEFDRLKIPVVVENLVAEKVIVMEYVSGTAIADVSGVVFNELDSKPLAEQIVNAYLKQTLIDGVFHADPHPGNMLLTRDHRIALLDAGMVVRLSPSLRRQLGMLMLAVSQSAGDEAATVAVEIGTVDDGFQVEDYRKAVGRIVAESQIGQGEGTSIGQALVKLLTASGEHGIVMPAELLLFTKALLQIEETLRRLDPSIHLGHLVEQFCPRIVKSRAAEKLSLTKLTQSALELADFSSELPQRLNRVTQLLADNELRVHVDAIDEQTLIAGIEKVANRITAGLVSAALIVAASVLMHITAGATASISSVLALLFFILAACVGLYLIYQVMFRDVGAKKGSKKRVI